MTVIASKTRHIKKLSITQMERCHEQVRESLAAMVVDIIKLVPLGLEELNLKDAGFEEKVGD